MSAVMTVLPCKAGFCFQEDITETKAATPKTVLGSVPGEDGFSDS